MYHERNDVDLLQSHHVPKPRRWFYQYHRQALGISFGDCGWRICPCFVDAKWVSVDYTHTLPRLDALLISSAMDHLMSSKFSWADFGDKSHVGRKRKHYHLFTLGNVIQMRFLWISPFHICLRFWNSGMDLKFDNCNTWIFPYLKRYYLWLKEFMLTSPLGKTKSVSCYIDNPGDWCHWLSPGFLGSWLTYGL